MQSPGKYTEYIQLPHSLKAMPKDVTASPVNLNEVIDITIRLKEEKSGTLADALKSGVRMTRDEFEKTFGSSDNMLSRLDDFLHTFHLTVGEVNRSARSVTAKGRIGDLEDAFHVYLSIFKDEKGNQYRGRTGYICIPKEMEDVIAGVFGLDDRPHAMPKLRAFQHDGVFVSHAASGGFTPVEVGQLYGFPTGVDGKGQCIAIIELGGGYRTQDINNYFTGLGLPTPVISSVSVDGGVNAPSAPNSADAEVMLDIEVAGAIAPGSRIVVYFATNTDKGFLDAVTKAVHDNVYKPSVISISWGIAEKHWTAQSMNSFTEVFQAAGILGITVLVASGDAGSGDGMQDGKVHVDFPASNPYVLACGGTRLNAQNQTIVSEVVWHESDSAASGGGVSEFFPMPDYQKNANIPPSLNASKFKGRGVPDVAGNADAATGYKVLVDGHQLVIGGTSAVAPLYAGLVALINQQKGTNIGFINPVLYQNPTLCRDIVQGNNITVMPGLGYKSQTGWDACTGLGVLSHF